MKYHAKKLLKKWSVFLLLAALILSSFGGCAAPAEPEKETPEEESQNVRPLKPEEKELLQQIAETERAYIASMQLSNGALPMTAAENGEVTVNPYFADVAAQALLTAGKQYQQQVGAYIRWHFAHLNTEKTDDFGVDGTIYDYKVTVKDGKVTEERAVLEEDGKRHYDSTDSYGATFLSLLRSYVEQTGDRELILPHYDDVNRIYQSILHTMTDDGLTGAKSNYPVVYLMDNCEVYRGITDVSWLYEQVFTEQSDAKKRAGRSKIAAQNALDGIRDVMWNPEQHAYLPSLSHKNIDWDTFYADATCQVFPILFSVDAPDSERAKSLYTQFNAHYGTGKKPRSWQTMEIPDAFSWAALARAAALMGDTQSVVTYMEHYREKMKEHKWPLYNADMGHAVIACQIMLDRAK